MKLWFHGRRSAFQAAAVLALLLGFALPARAVTIQDLVALSKAGLSDQVLIALIQTDQTIYGVDAHQVLALRKAGVHEPVILALLRNGRETAKTDAGARATPPAASPTEAPAEVAPAVTIVGDHRSDEERAVSAEPSTIVVQTVVPVPVVIGTGRAHHGHHAVARPAKPTAPAFSGFGRFINSGFVSGTHATAGGTSIDADGWHIVTPKVVPVHVPGQH